MSASGKGRKGYGLHWTKLYSSDDWHLGLLLVYYITCTGHLGALMIGQHFESIKCKVSAGARKPKSCGFLDEAAGHASLFLLTLNLLRSENDPESSESINCPLSLLSEPGCWIGEPQDTRRIKSWKILSNCKLFNWGHRTAKIWEGMRLHNNIC